MLFLPCGCQRTSQKKDKPKVTISATSSRSPAAVPVASHVQAGSVASAPGSAPSASERLVETAEKDRLRNYWKEMAQGRFATTKKSFATAITAFDHALEAMPDDARAYAERGYAQLLAKNFRLARQDFDRAVERTDDRKLLAQIWYNYGLTADEEGRTKDALAAFARSNEMNPTAAAAKRLGGVPTCTARVTEREGSEDAAPATVESDWLGVFDRLAQKIPQTTRPPSSEAARKLLCHETGCKLAPGEGQAISLQAGRRTSLSVVISLAEQKLRVFPGILAYKAGPCGSHKRATVVHQKPLQLHAESTQMLERFAHPDGSNCEEGSADDCVRKCRVGTTAVLDMLFSVSGEEIPLTVEQWAPPDGKAPWAVTVSGEDARIQGEGCNLSWSLQ
jgi:hypothetical protein